MTAARGAGSSDAGTRNTGTRNTGTRGTVTRGTVTIDVEQCKGCELCIAACRPGVLVMSSETNDNGYRFPLLEPGCTACRACRDVCPDYCFEVFKFDQPVEN